MKKIELKDAIEKEVIKREIRRFALAGGRNIGALELSKAKIEKGEFGNSEINKINSNVHVLKENIESFANWFYNLDKKNKEDFLLFYKGVELIDNKKGIVFGFAERNEKAGTYELWTVNDAEDKLQFPQSYYHSGIGFVGVKIETPSVSKIKEYLEDKKFKRFNALKVAEDVFEAFGISEEEQFQVVRNELPSLETII